MRSAIGRSIANTLLKTLVLIAAGLNPASAHEGHDHGAPPPPVSSTIAPRAEASSADLELVAVARGSQLTIYLDAYKTNRPVVGAALEVDSSSGILKPKETAPGVYAVEAPFLRKSGPHDLAITVTTADVVDLLTATLSIPQAAAPEASLGGSRFFGIDPAIAADVRRRLPVDSLPVLLWIAIGFGAGVAATLLRKRLRLGLAAILLVSLSFLAPAPATADPGPASVALRDISQRLPDGSLFVPKPSQRILALTTVFSEAKPFRRAVELPGRIIPDPNGSGLVQASVGGRLVPPVGGFKPLGTRVATGDILAYVRPPLGAADATSQQQQARELDQQISIVSRKVERLRAIERVIARSQLEDAELELKGLQARRANLERANREPEPLTAPVDGVLAASNAVAGQMAEPNAVIFQIVDPARLWVEALSFEPQATTGTAQGLFAGGRTIALDFVGAGLADRNQTVPIHFAIKGVTPGLRAGQLLTVLAETTDERTGIALPREAVLRSSNGQIIVYEHTNAERFLPREVRVEPLDAERVLVLSGLEPGKRIVTQGAELLNQIR